MEAFVRENAGYRLDGWMIEWVPLLYVRAIHHAVWAHEDGRRLDVTALSRATASPGETTFIPDQRRKIDLNWPVGISDQFVKLVHDADLDEFVAAEHETNSALRKLFLELRMAGIYSWAPGSISPSPPLHFFERLHHAKEAGRRRANSASERLKVRYSSK